MIELEDLVKLIEVYNPDEVDIVKKAYYFAEELHKGQVRQSGEPYISHPLNVAFILAEMHADRDTVCAGLLHDTLEDTETTKEMIAQEFNKNGLDMVEFVITTNIGEEEKSLIKIASGGEMSRIMLAIKSVLANVDKVPVLIFDEIDIGISGKAAKSVGTKMKKIAKKHQILCVTHLATIAAKGDYNYYISKEVKNDKTRTKVEKLNEEKTIKEIARIASGDINEVSIEYAKQLRKVG